MKKITSFFRYKWLMYQWKRRSRKRRRSKLKVGNINAFFAALNESDISYLVLRWFDEVPRSLQEEQIYDGDLDLLVESAQLEQFCRIAAYFPGKIKVDLYSNGIRLGTDCKRVAYYPPVLGSEMLSNSCLYENRFKRPAAKEYLYSLLYHCVYHKGLLCALPSGTGLQSNDIYDHDLQAELSQTAAECGEQIPEELTLLNIHKWLIEREWNMPYDLIGRWPAQTKWHEELLKIETDKMLQDLKPLKNILVFLIREDAIESSAQEAIVKELKQKFKILEIVELSAQQQAEVMRKTRGGDWTKHKATTLVKPMMAVICEDKNPQDIKNNPELANKHPFVENANVFFKHEIRNKLEKEFTLAINFLHGSDNDAESMAYIKAIFKDTWQEKIEEWGRG